MKKLFVIISCTILCLCSCSKKMDLNNSDSIKSFLSEHTIFLEGDLEFFNNGTFSLIPQSPNDPTRLYTGTYAIGDCKNCDKDYASREITIKFNNTGWVTDEHKIDGVHFSGFGTDLEGKIVEDIDKENKTGWKIEFKQSGNDGLVWDSDAGTEGGFVKSKAKFERSFSKKTEEQLTHIAPVISNKKEDRNKEIETENKAAEIMGEFTLISGGCHEDGCTFVFKDNTQKEYVASTLPENIVKFTETDDGGTVVNELYLNKKYSITYILQQVRHEASNNTNQEIKILKMK